MKTQLLTIKQYAELKGQTQQAIYKSINAKKIKCKIVKGQKYIVVADAELNENEQRTNKEQTQNNDAVIELLKQQLIEKDKQIENLTIANNNLTTLLGVKEQQVLQLTYKPTLKEKIKGIFKNKSDANN